ncbi:FAD-binding protein [Cupriavidus basilensis]
MLAVIRCYVLHKPQILGRTNGRPIDGLYAVGLDSNSMMRGCYPGGGLALGPAMTFGRIAARHILRS